MAWFRTPSLIYRATTQLRYIRVHVRHGADGLGRCVWVVARRVSTLAEDDPKLRIGRTTYTLLSRGIFFFTGPVLLTFAMIFEWVMGNFFPMMVMGLFDVFWLSFGVLQLPTLQLGSQYVTEADPTGTAAPAFNAAIALYLIVWGFALLTFFFFTLKINVVFASIFGLVTVASFVLSGAYWKVSQGNFDDALKLQKVSGQGLTVMRRSMSVTDWLRTGRRCVDICRCPPGMVCTFYTHERRDAGSN